MNLSARCTAVTAPLVAVAWLSLGGCGSSDSSTGAASAGSSAASAGSNSGGSSGAAAAGDSSTLVGSFQVKLTAESDLGAANTTVVGKVYDGPTPATVVWESPQVDGDCTLTTPRVPFCNTPCGGSAACVEDDTCLAYPTARGVGAVTVSGLAASPFQLTAVSNTYQAPASATLAYPPFADGDPVSVSAAGDYFGAFSINAKGIAPLVLQSTGLALKTGQALELSWAKGATSDAKIHVKLDISHHGGSKGQIECDTADSGALSVSAALVTKLLNLGVAGYPTVIVTRHSTGSTVIAAGRVDLEVSSVVEQAVTVEGLASCTSDDDCATGQTCQNDLTCK